jgi:hypothetical protein
MTVFNGLGDGLRRWLGIGQSSVSRQEQIVSGVGGLLGIIGVLFVSGPLLHEPAGAIVVASMGASAVLLFAVPHGPLSQPWALVGGHHISAFIGVTCAMFIPDTLVSASLAVGLSITAMHILRCIHPPGGATALSAVVGGPEVQALGYQYMVTPVFLNVSVILLVAIVFNYPFRWRRYPLALSRPDVEHQETAVPELIDHDRLMKALQKLDTFMDISEQDLLKIYSLAGGGSEEALTPDQIKPGVFYSNGAFGAEWQVREVLEIIATGDGRELVSYRPLAGHGRKTVGKCGLMEFSRWARYRVERNENSWQRITD